MRTFLRMALLALMLTAACAPPAAQDVENTADAPTEVVAVAPTEVAAVAPTEAVAVTVTEPPAATAEATVVEATEVAKAAPTEARVPRPNLEATDPSTVALAAGKPQLVEFFAFW